MAVPLEPHQLRSYLAESLRAAPQQAVVEYYHTTRDPVTAKAVDKTAQWLRRRAHRHVAVCRVDISKDHGRHLDRLGVRVLPQPSTVAIYGPDGRPQLHAGPLASSSNLVQRLGLGKSSAQPRHPAAASAQ